MHPIFNVVAFTSLSFALSSSAIALPEAQFQNCLNQLQTQYTSRGISRSSFEALRPFMVQDESVLPLLDKQPEFSTAIWDYLSALVDEERVTDGLTAMQTHQASLLEISKKYQIEASTVAAVWGVESNFGRIQGGRPLLSSLATLSCEGRRQSFFRGELASAIKIVNQGDVEPDKFVGSWAGAFGQTQFMPSTFLNIAVDFDNDGKRDLINNAADALGSTANYLKKAGWVTGQPWGFEVKLPTDFDYKTSGRIRKQSLSYWMNKGLTKINGQVLTSAVEPRDVDWANEFNNNGPLSFQVDDKVSILVPSGSDGPAFLIGKNFDAIYAYNASESYALAIALLNDQMAGRPGLKTAWPTDDPGLSRAQRRELQGLLILKGYEIGNADGMIGAKSRAAIVDFQKQIGLKPDGRPGFKTLEALKK
jgi:glucose-6-phosphate 1-epimerase